MLHFIQASIAGLGLLLFTSCSFTFDSKDDNHSHEEVAGTYQCPMLCEGDATYDSYRQCPVCKMDLEIINNEQNDSL